MIRTLALALVTLFVGAACSHGYRDPEDSKALERDIDDKNIATRVRFALGEDAQTAPYKKILVTCEMGVVTLEGAVDRESVKQRAEDVAASCAGVRGVDNRLSVRGASGRG